MLQTETNKDSKKMNGDILNPVKLDSIRSIYETKLKNGGEIFKREFEELNEITNQNILSLEPDDYNIEENKTKNRYDWIHGYSHSKVSLSENRYINASYIDGAYNPSKFIATQGPLLNTIKDFWSMIWQQNVRIIVMLANVVENGQVRCDIYWPTNKAISCGDLSVTLERQICHGEFVKRILKVKNEQDKQVQEVIQFHYTSWPDHGVPATSSGLMRLHNEMMKEWMKSQETGMGPIVTHCSAGVGRTGTFLCFDILCEQIKQKNQDTISVAETVIRMRKRRTIMLQTLTQYIFVHNLILERLMLPTTDKTTDQLVKDVQGKNRIFAEEYELLSKIPRIQHHESQMAPYQKSSSIVPMMEGSIIARDIQLYHCNFTVLTNIANGGHEMVWRKVIEKGTKVVIAFSNAAEYKVTYPGHCSSENQDDITVMKQDQTDHVRYVPIQLKLSSRGKDSSAALLHCNIWNRQPFEYSEAYKFFKEIEMIQNARQQNGIPHPIILIGNSDDIGKCAVICVILASLERKGCEDKIDILRMVKDARDCLKDADITPETYEFICEIVYEMCPKNLTDDDKSRTLGC